MNDVQNVAERVKRAYGDACRGVESALMDDKVLQARNGEKTINDGFLYAETRERAFRSVETSRGEAMDAIEKARKRATSALTAAPSVDESNYILSISGRDDLTAGEVSAALGRYSSHAAQRAIISAARRSGVHVDFGETEAEKALSALDALEARTSREFDVNRISSSSESGRLVAGNGFTAMFAGDSINEQFAALLNG